ncbi:MAG: hypothetical protein FJ090_06480 [Deltaproteobacteria bacterium]|nr:hypothetical protein [Deltaproteobacteria bacterium]
MWMLVACAPGSVGLGGDSGGGDTAAESVARDSAGETGADSGDDTAADTATDTATDTGSSELLPWPASLPPAVTALAGLEEDFEISLSGATWNAATRELWVVRGDGATAWALARDGEGDWAIDREADLGSLDLESVVVPDPVGAPGVIYLMVEHEERIQAVEVSASGVATLGLSWDTSPYLPTSGSLGSEGLAFVPDAALAAGGFVDGAGVERTSRLGHDGLFFVGTQNGGAFHVFDLSDNGTDFEQVGEFQSARDDLSGLEWDASAGRLYAWHGGDHNDLGVYRLSSTSGTLDLEAIYDFPGDDNIEGLALLGTEDCVDGKRPLVLTIDDGRERALDVYEDWPLGCGE